MRIKISSVGEVKVVGFEGEFDSHNFNVAEMRIMELIHQGVRKILLDFGELEYINSAGLKILLMASKELKEVEGELRLCSPNKMVKEIFDYSGFYKIFNIFDDRDKALAGF